MKTEIKASLGFTDFPMSPQDLTKELGIEPTNSWRTGEIGTMSKLPMKNNGWELGSGLELSRDFESHLKALLDKIRPYKENFIDAGKKYPAILSCIVYIYGQDRPFVGFESTSVKELAELNATIDIDLYILTSSQP
jgi:hypothetical protein